jgi:predicted secreted protein
MLRSKNLIMVCHCVLNQNSVVCPLARTMGSFKFVKKLIDEGIGIIQLPCPEFKFLGTTRKPMDKEEYDIPEYRSLCKGLLIPVIEDMEIYLKDGYVIKGIIGINESPTCSISGSRGIFMEELFSELEKRNMELSFSEVPVDYEDDRDSEKFFSKLKKKLLE